MSASLLLTSIVYSIQLWRRHKAEICVIERIQAQTWTVIIPFAVFQLATGFTMISLQHYSISEYWIRGSAAGFILVVISWFGFIYCLLSAQQSAMTAFFRKLQWVMLCICTLSLLSMIFFMVSKI